RDVHAGPLRDEVIDHGVHLAQIARPHVEAWRGPATARARHELPFLRLKIVEWVERRARDRECRTARQAPAAIRFDLEATPPVAHGDAPAVESREAEAGRDRLA